MKQICKFAFRMAIVLGIHFTLLSCSTFRYAYLDRRLIPQAEFLPQWEKIREGIDLARVSSPPPELAIYCLRIDLSKPGISVLVTPPEPTLPGGYEARLMRTSDFAKRYGLTAAINATPFTPLRLSEGEPCKISGLSVSKGRLVSPPDSRYAALVFSNQGTARILHPDEAYALSDGAPDILFGVGGFSVLLRNGEITRDQFETTYDRGRAPRSAAGVSRSGTILFLMVIDGKNRGHSVGATFEETAAWIAAFGADSALMLDGGGSSTLVLADDQGVPRVENIPVQTTIPHIERPVANHIGIIFATETN